MRDLANQNYSSGKTRAIPAGAARIVEDSNKDLAGGVEPTPAPEPAVEVLEPQAPPGETWHTANELLDATPQHG